ncbi:MAG: acyltransferase [Acidobacteriota bacterium]|nr:acyltransferase [Acidobacteriota bacterium]
MNQPPAQKYLGLQDLRIIAACLVLLTHSTFYVSERLDKSFPVWNRGTSGVDIFFVISRFVMIYSSRSLFASVDGWKVFAERRVARIVPLYWFATTLKLIVMLFSAGLVRHTRLSFAAAAYSYLFLPAANSDGEIRPVLGVGWTLNFEMFFYFFFTLALFFHANVYKFVGIILTALAIGAYFRRPSWPPVAFYLDTIMLEFFFGMLIAKACVAGKHLSRNLCLPLMAASLFVLLHSWPDWHVPKALLDGVPAAMIIWSAASLGDGAKYIPRFVLYLADASYAIYLMHPMIAPLAPALLMRMHIIYAWISIACSIILALAAGSIVHQMAKKSCAAAK